MVWQILSRLTLGGVLISSAITYQALPVLACGILVAGSSIPVALRLYRDRILRKAKAAPGELEALMEMRLAEFEDRNFQFLNDLEDRNAERLEAVEERIDYAEQLIARRHEIPNHDPKPFKGLPVVTPV